MMITPFPRPVRAMMEARKAAFRSSVKRPFNHELFATQTYQLRQGDDSGADRASLIDAAVDHLAIHPDGSGIGYFLIEGASQGRTVEQVRRFSFDLFCEVWERFRLRSHRFAPERNFFCAQTLTEDGKIPEDMYGSRWSFKSPHADRNGILFAHVYGPTVGYEGGDVFLLDAIAYVRDSGFDFEDALTWSDEPVEQKPVLRKEHVSKAIDRYGRRLGRMDHDKILLVNNTPEGLFHGATEVMVKDGAGFSRVLHRSVVRERE